MIRRFNYTGRFKLERRRIQIRLIPENNKPPSFSANIDLNGLNLPETARVYIEAYDKNSYMRFGYGSVAHIAEPPVSDRILSELQSTDAISFRIKVVDESGKHGKILAIADRIVTRRQDEKPVSRENLLYVRYADIGDEIWNLDLSDFRPVLQLNNRIEGIGEMARNEPFFFSLVYPAVVKLILIQILIVDEHEFDEIDTEDWRNLWLKFINDLPSLSVRYNPDLVSLPDAKLEWIEDEAVPAFCKSQQVLTRFIQSQESPR
ncbi:MAG: hypothetical protein QMD46_13680 [Methanomicrobiales archaeon]|nr:hypothetical protein [Methanomicrobiales archaeon]MDI6876297.1 hypothetical protein [Methanomicrobiales archaeon]